MDLKSKFGHQKPEPDNPEFLYYDSPRNPGVQDTSGLYFPKAVVDPFVLEAREQVSQISADNRGLTNLFSKSGNTQGPRFTFEDSRALVIAAMEDYSPELGRKAREIFDAGYDQAVADARARTTPRTFDEWTKQQIPRSNPAVRWRLEQVAPGHTQIQCSNPADSEINPNKYSVIDYQFDGTIDSVVFTAHELGHCIGDDYLRQTTKMNQGNTVNCTHKDNPVHMQETQAYFTQSILYGYMQKHSTELEDKFPGITKAAQDHLKAQANVYLQRFPIAIDARRALQSSKNGELANTAVTERWIGHSWRTRSEGRELADGVEIINSATPGTRLYERGTKLLNAEVESLHSRPMGLFTALGVYNQVKDLPKDDPRRQAVADAILDKNGPSTIDDVLEAAEVERSDLREFAHSAVTTALGNKYEGSTTPAAIQPKNGQPVSSPAPV